MTEKNAISLTETSTKMVSAASGEMVIATAPLGKYRIVRSYQL